MAANNYKMVNGMIVHPQVYLMLGTIFSRLIQVITTASSTDNLIQYIDSHFTDGGQPLYINARIKQLILPDMNVTAAQVIRYLTSDILNLAGNSARDAGDSTIYPEDIVNVLVGDEELSILLETPRPISNGFSRDIPFHILIHATNTLHPVTIPLQVLPGIDAFNRAVKKVSGSTPYTIYFANAIININDDEPQAQRYHPNRGRYIITIAGEQYGVRNQHFFRGLVSAANWIGVNHHHYWSNLYERSNPNVPLTFD